jgi:superoxide dismutase, Fe-Mn family
MPNGDLLNLINAQFGSLESFQKTMSAATVAVQGSGWGWLGNMNTIHLCNSFLILTGYDKTSNRLSIATCANQDPLQATTGLVPLLGIDVWEHAYYLQVGYYLRYILVDYYPDLFSVQKRAS